MKLFLNSSAWASERMTSVFLLLGVLWIGLVGVSFGWYLRNENVSRLELAQTEARSLCQKDLDFRAWATAHGGVYVVDVDPTRTAATNNFSAEATTPSGQRLILVEPDTFLRQVHAQAQRMHGMRSHVTSLKPLRPENVADAWESNAMRTFFAGSNEFSSEVLMDGQPFLRLMRPMVTEAACLKCHEEQNFKVGDIRGGISVLVSLTNYQKVAWAQILPILIGHGFFVVIGLGGLWFGHRHLSHSLQARDRAMAAQREGERRFQLLFDKVSNIAVQGYGPDGTVRFWNQASEQLYGYTATEACGRNMLDLIIPPEMRSAVRKAIRQMFETGQPLSAGELSLMRKDGSRVPVYSNHTIVDSENRIRELYCLDIELTESKRAEADLRVSELRFRTVVESTNDAIFISIDLKFNYLNPAALRLFGACKQEDLIGLPVLDRIHPNYHESVRQRSAVTETGQGAVPAQEEIYLRLNGSSVFVEVEANPISYQGKQGAIVFVRDISERKRAGELLREQLALQELIAQIAATVPGVIYTFLMRPNGSTCFPYASAAVEDYFGVVAKALTADSSALFASVHRDDIGRVQSGIAESAHKLVTWWDEFRVNHPIRGELWILGRAVPQKQADGSILWHGFATEVTERKQAEQAWHQREAELRTLMGHIPHKIFLKDRNLRFVFINQSIAQDLGIRPEDAVGKVDDDFLPKELADQYRTEEQRVLDTGQTLELEEKRTRPNREIWIHAVKAPVCDEHGKIIGLCGIFRDITEQRKLELQFLRAQRLESIGQLAGGIAHDINNLLAPIMMIMPMLREHLEDKEDQLLATTVEVNAQRGAQIVKQILMFSRGTAPAKAPVLSQQLFREVTSVLVETIPRTITLMNTAPPDLWVVEGDASQLHQVLMNLCVNARDAMPNGGVLILHAENLLLDAESARKILDAHEGAYVVWQISDTGSGIAPEHLERIFDPFFTTKEIGKGTGLGLSTVIGIVRSHHGCLEVSSKVGQGTQFRILLPATSAPIGPLPKGEAVAAPRGNGELVLVVDDEQSVLPIVRITLEKAGYRVLAVSGGAEALCLFAQQAEDIGLILMDMDMPHPNGETVIRTIRQTHPEIRIICMSGHPGRSEVNPLPAAFLDKPFEPNQLLEAIHRVLTEKLR